MYDENKMGLDDFKKNGKYLLLAFDHRGSFKKIINPQNPDLVTDEEAIDAKKDVIDSVYEDVTGVLVDRDIGLKAYAGKSKPFILPLEKSGYVENLGERLVELDKSASELIELGARGAKILIYFNPYVESAKKQIEISKQVIEDCKDNNLPIFYEIRVYKPDTGDDLGDDSEKLVIDSLEMLLEAEVYPDVWKLEYPGSIAGCQRVTRLVGETPWILLTRGVGFEAFVPQLKDAMISGAKGFLAGRAVWQEIGQMHGEERKEYLEKTLPERFKLICDIALG